MSTPNLGRQFTPGAVRTATPFLVGWLVSFLARHGLDLNDDNAAYLIGALGGYLFYMVVRFCEVFVGDKWRYVLGLGIVAAAPAYVEPPALVRDQTGTQVVKGDSGRGMLGTIGAALVIIGALLLLLHLLSVIVTSVIGCIVGICIGVVLLLVDGDR